MRIRMVTMINLLFFGGESLVHSANSDPLEQFLLQIYDAEETVTGSSFV